MPISADTVFSYLSDLDYPAQKEDVVRRAEANGASEDVLSALRALPLGSYASRDDVRKGLNTP